MSDIDQTARSQDWTMLLPDFGYGTLLDGGRRALDRWTHGMFECSRAFGAFAMARWQEDLETWKALGNCRSIDELLQCECSYVQKAAADYMAEMGKLTQVMLEAANAALRPEAAEAAPAQPQSWEVAASPASPVPAPSRPASSRRAAAARASSEHER
jgi:hypothetical protein